MLVLNRYVSESVFIGDNITVTILEVRGNQVRLGFQAPPEVHIVREELIERDRREREQ